MSNTKFRIVKYNDSFEECEVLQVCHSYEEADQRFEYWDEKYANAYIEILTPEEWRYFQLGSNPSVMVLSHVQFSLREKCKNYTGKVSLRRERLNNGGYTKDGVYFGVGDRLYYMADDDGIHDHYFRASCREDAIEIGKVTYPNGKFRK